ncbi:prepilin-type N-terminal cleavage/methylation domain-containing protein [Pseudoalteromonas sp. APC 3355]|uniref:prepilin-type N-terminal cleavage/methylation domain-containing protein n=1 Tax=Pseudoalteromonas sp. APC 3355 TaxID=3035199 RepID=UPI0025B28B8A|nr:prepilin-type N-terminal cleavage/methylation domain-containing protein [Pseudoalteromonas sp. APC 3355]MDN3475387.1 prepilin-type N-terminal cleavage/methylation domain-containing protein [Pseudoalteromonas sp. APC 3355]
MKSDGFTLVELMISVLILAILASISFSVYQNIYSKSIITSCFAEISSARSAFEVIKNESIDIIPSDNLTQLNILSAKSCKYHELRVDEIIGHIADGKNISGSKISLVREPLSAVWQCQIYDAPSTFQVDYLPNGCTLR